MILKLIFTCKLLLLSFFLPKPLKGTERKSIHVIYCLPPYPKLLPLPLTSTHFYILVKCESEGSESITIDYTCTVLTVTKHNVMEHFIKPYSYELFTVPGFQKTANFQIQIDYY